MRWRGSMGIVGSLFPPYPEMEASSRLVVTSEFCLGWKRVMMVDCVLL